MRNSIQLLLLFTIIMVPDNVKSMQVNDTMAGKNVGGIISQHHFYLGLEGTTFHGLGRARSRPHKTSLNPEGGSSGIQFGYRINRRYRIEYASQSDDFVEIKNPVTDFIAAQGRNISSDEWNIPEKYQIRHCGRRTLQLEYNLFASKREIFRLAAGVFGGMTLFKSDLITVESKKQIECEGLSFLLFPYTYMAPEETIKIGRMQASSFVYGAQIKLAVRIKNRLECCLSPGLRFAKYRFQNIGYSYHKIIDGSLFNGKSETEEKTFNWTYYLHTFNWRIQLNYLFN